jgi:hypothetical protein
MAIEASLTERPDLAVMRLNPHLPDVAGRITSLAPAAVIIERGGNGDLALALLGRGFPLIERGTCMSSSHPTVRQQPLTSPICIGLGQAQDKLHELTQQSEN